MTPIELPTKKLRLNFVYSDQTCKIFKRPVISSFCIIREATCRKLPVLQMIADTLTTYSFSGAGFITAIAMGKVLAFVAFHIGSN